MPRFEDVEAQYGTCDLKLAGAKHGRERDVDRMSREDVEAGAACNCNGRKPLSLCCMVVQNVLVIFLIRRTKTVRHAGQPPYLSTVAIFFAELLKLVSAAGMVMGEEKGICLGATAIWRGVLGSPSEMLKMSVLGFMYAVQSNLLFVGLANLPCGVYSATSQLKTPMTAVCSLLLLGRKLTWVQWLSLILLCAGVAVLQAQQSNSQLKDPIEERPLLGVAAVGGASILSASASVFLEMMLKSGWQSLWMRNVQLAFVGAPMTLAIAFWTDGTKIHQAGLLQGFDALTWLVVFMHAVGGFAVAAVMLHADNILKCFGVAIAVVFCCMISAASGEFYPNLSVIMSVLVVVVASLLYSIGVPLTWSSSK